MSKVHFDWSPEKYFAVPAASSTNLRLFDRSPAHLRWALANPKEATKAQKLGRLAHLAILESAYFKENYYRGPEGDKRTKPVRALWLEAEEDFGAEFVLAPDLFDTIQSMRDAVHSHPVASKLLLAEYGAANEASCFWDDVFTDVACKARIDALPIGEYEGCVVDLKTTLDASRDKFSRSCVQFGYEIQAAHYLEAWSAAGDNERPSFLFVALEKTPPFGCSVFCMDPASVELGRRKIDRLLERWAWCESDDDWPGYEEGIQDLSLPGYAFTREIE